MWHGSQQRQLLMPRTPARLTILPLVSCAAEKARQATLPPLQSMMELTTAYKPPERGTTTVTATEQQQQSARGRALPDGAGVLPDGSRWGLLHCPAQQLAQV